MNHKAHEDIFWPNGELRAAAGEVFDDFMDGFMPPRAAAYLGSTLYGYRFTKTEEPATTHGIPPAIEQDFRFFDVPIPGDAPAVAVEAEVVEEPYEEVEADPFPDPNEDPVEE